ncbi:MAG: polyprenyl synthetase family protein [Planctomycetota bacterium]|nr:MAG: polyprenyl synthetase family protein [Planctomycetota bacterium]
MIESAAFSLDCYCQAAREKIDRQLSEYTQFDDGCPDHLREAIRYSLLAPGKRLRPTLVLLAAEACGAEADAALPAACAVEMVHAYSLVHDDLPAMDDDDLRRGRPTCHKAFGEAVAILVGDALLTLAFEVLARDTQPPKVAARCCALLGRAAGAAQLVGGQADDLNEQFSGGGLETLEAIHRRKTGAILRVSLELGAVVASASDKEREALLKYGQGLGLAFQITDDLLDVTGDAQAMGKRAGKDSDHGKLTFPGILGIEESKRRAETLVADACQALEPFAARGEGLQALAQYVLNRNH